MTVIVTISLEATFDTCTNYHAWDYNHKHWCTGVKRMTYGFEGTRNGKQVMHIDAEVHMRHLEIEDIEDVDGLKEDAYEEVLLAAVDYGSGHFKGLSLDHGTLKLQDVDLTAWILVEVESALENTVDAVHERVRSKLPEGEEDLVDYHVTPLEKVGDTITKAWKVYTGHPDVKS